MQIEVCAAIMILKHFSVSMIISHFGIYLREREPCVQYLNGPGGRHGMSVGRSGTIIKKVCWLEIFDRTIVDTQLQSDKMTTADYWIWHRLVLSF